MVVQNTLPLIHSPLNYTGGKFRLLPQILPLFPKEIDTFIDLFAGGCNVGINVPAKKVIMNDINRNVILLFKTMQEMTDAFESAVDSTIDEYGLSRTDKYGYLKLREAYNKLENKESRQASILFFTLIVHSFNNQIRYNGKGYFNIPVGKRDFNRNLRSNLNRFIERLLKYPERYTFTTYGFRDFPLTEPEKSFVYCDPPYIISEASYNRKSGNNPGWGESEEKALLEYLDTMNEQGYLFAMSNILKGNNRENHILNAWIEDNKGRYNVTHLDYSYGNSSYHKKDREAVTDEVLIRNYV